jgi:septal ring factor EnvC (AmiA/AmiB activator)
MASRKEIKDELNELSLGLISDAFTYMKLHPQGHREKVMKIISAATEVRNDVIYRINHPSGKPADMSMTRYYGEIRKELLTRIDQLSQDLSKLVKEGKKKGK